MGKVKQSLNSLLLCLFEAVIGILLLINPVDFTSGIIIAFGIVLALNGVGSIVKYFRMNAKEAMTSQILMKGLLFLLGGVFCILQSRWFVATFPLLTMLYGVVLLVIGIGKVQWTADLIRLKEDKWHLMALNAAVSLICAAVILFHPMGTTRVLWMFTGASLIVEAVFDLAALFMNSKKKAV